MHIFYTTRMGKLFMRHDAPNIEFYQYGSANAGKQTYEIEYKALLLNNGLPDTNALEVFIERIPELDDPQTALRAGLYDRELPPAGRVPIAANDF
eukprot:3034691-Prymnesium_polylepis.1